MRLAVGTLAALCAQHGVRLVHLSTDYVLDYPNEDRLTEALSPNPKSVYAAVPNMKENSLHSMGPLLRGFSGFSPGNRGFFNHA